MKGPLCNGHMCSGGVADVSCVQLTAEQRKQRSNQSKYLEKAFAEMYKETDAQLIAWCKEREIHYSACTSVTVLVHHPSNRMLVGHIGDSHAVLGTSSTGQPDAAKVEKSDVLRPLCQVIGVYVCVCGGGVRGSFSRLDTKPTSLQNVHALKPMVDP